MNIQEQEYQKNLKEIQIKALSMYKADMEKIYEKVSKKCDKEHQKLKEKIASVTEYKTEDEIMDMYGFGCISEKKKDELIDMFRKTKANIDNLINEPTPLKEYKRMLKFQINSMEAEINLLKAEIKECNFN